MRVEYWDKLTKIFPALKLTKFFMVNDLRDLDAMLYLSFSSISRLGEEAHCC